MSTTSIRIKNPLLTAGSLLVFAFLTPAVTRADRTQVCLDGQWQIADSRSATEMPFSFSHSVPVPGLANLSSPAFPNVDAFYSR